MATRRQILAAMLSGLASRSIQADLSAFVSDVDPAVFKIAFGSCVSQRADQAFWSQILVKDPAVFVMMGDGVYPEHEGETLPVLEAIEAAYRQAAKRTELADFRKRVPVIAIWDDNDYGGSDIGASFAHKHRSRELFLDFWATPEEQRIRNREAGIYGLWEFGSDARRVQVIVPDLRYCRSEWAQNEAEYLETLRSSGFGPYVARGGAEVSMLGETQWRWLAACLRRPARVRLLVSSIQCLPEGRGWESWSNFPAEKARLLKLVRDTRAEGLVILSGDSHYGEVSRLDGSELAYPLWEITSSGLTEVWPTPGPNPYRIGDAYAETNFGLIHVNWLNVPPMIVLELYSTSGERLRQETLLLDELAVEA